MAIVEVSERAKSDFDEIIARLESLAGNRVAVKFVVSLSRAIVGLADFPGQGAPRPRLGRDMRVLIVSPYLILYEYALGRRRSRRLADRSRSSQDHATVLA